MDRNYIVELIKENRLQEAIKAIEKASKGSHLHNQVILLSSSYAEYAELNRSATEDFETLQLQRAKITNRLLSFLDEISPEDLEKVTPTPKQSNYSPPQAQTSAPTFDKKWLIYGGGALAVLLVIFLIASGGDTEANVSQGGNDVKQAVNTNETEAITARNARFVFFNNEEGERSQFREYEYGKWIEENLDHPNPDAVLRFDEQKRDDASIYLRNKTQKVGITIQLDFVNKHAKCTNDKEKPFIIGPITGYH